MESVLTKNVLIADDQEPVRQLLSDFLTFAGYEVIMASNGKEALDILKNKACRALITDLNMPFINGIDLVIKARHLNSSLSIIGMSIEKREADFLMAGADYFISKPINLNNLKSILAEIFRQ